jgi:hypothetical protein
VLLPIGCDRDPAHRNIELAGLKILHQPRPGGLNILDLDAECLAHRLGHVDVEAAEFRGRLVKIGERQIVAGHADTQGPAVDDVVEARGLLGMSRCGHQAKAGGEAGQDSKH